MATVYDVDPNKLIEETAKDIAKLANVKAPSWSIFVKTGNAKERPPFRDDWWYVRAASILRAIYTSHGPIGVQKLRIKYGSKKNRGHKPEHFYPAGGKIIRAILQQLEKEGFLKQVTIDVHKGRIITPKGKSFIDKIASRFAVKRKVEQPKEEKPEEKHESAEKPQTDEKKAEEKHKKTAKPEAQLKQEAEEKKARAVQEEKHKSTAKEIPLKENE